MRSPPLHARRPARRARGPLLVACLLGLALSAARIAAAQPEPPDAPRPAASPDEIKIARQTALDGLIAYKASEFEKALDLFEQARAVYPSAQILRMTGYSHLALQHWEKAAEALEQALTSDLGPLDEKDRKEVDDQLARALSHFGMVSVSTAVPDAELSIDGGPPRKLPLIEPIRLLEGRHRFVVSAEGHTDAEEEVKIDGGKPVELALDPVPIAVAPPPKPKPPPKPAPPPLEPWKGFFPHQREIGLAAAGAGLALGGVALITGLVGADLRGNVEEDARLHEQGFGMSCERGDYRLCVYDRAIINSDADRADTLRDASVWTGITSAVLVAGGATLFLLAPGSPLAPGPRPRDAAAPREEPRAATLACGPLLPGISCMGSF